MLGELKAFCRGKAHCLFLEKRNRKEVLIMLLLIKGALKINPFVNWVKNETDPAGLSGGIN